MPETERFRIQVDVPEDLYLRTQKNFPWGVRNSVMVRLIDELNQTIETHGIIVAYLIMENKVKLFGGLLDESLGIVKVKG